MNYGGKKTLVDIVFGRKPRDVVTIENSSPEQLSMPVSSLEQIDQTLQKIAMKSYLEARQRADLRRDIAKFNTVSLLVVGTRREFSLRKEPSVSLTQVPQFSGSTSQSCGKKKRWSLQQILFLVNNLISHLILLTQDIQFPRSTG